VATLLNVYSDTKINLQPHHIFGRHRSSSSTVLSTLDASRIHAVIIWDGEHWLVLDTSTNGTFINGVRIQKESRRRLEKSDRIHFGSDKTNTWFLLDTTPPQSMLEPVTPGLPNIVLKGIVALPSEETPEVLLYMSPQGQWLCESAAGISVLQSGDCVGTHDNVWRFIEAKPCLETQVLEENRLDPLLNIKFNFDVSQNEEHVFLKLKVDHQEFDLGQRNHHYLLLLLARQRMNDKAAGLNISEQGWVDKDLLSQMLKLNENHINIQIHRLRKQMIDTLPKSLTPPQAIERRAGEIRFVCDTVQINGGLLTCS